MPPLTDPALLAMFKKAFSDWRVGGVVLWRRGAEEWLHRNLPNITMREVNRSLHEHFEGGGQLFHIKETRPNWWMWEYWYKFKSLPIGGRKVFVEMRLDDRDPDEPVIHVVNMHE